MAGPEKNQRIVEYKTRERVPFSGDPDDPEGKKEKNRKLREKEEKAHGHK